MSVSTGVATQSATAADTRTSASDGEPIAYPTPGRRAKSPAWSTSIRANVCAPAKVTVPGCPRKVYETSTTDEVSPDRSRRTEPDFEVVTPSQSVNSDGVTTSPTVIVDGGPLDCAPAGDHPIARLTTAATSTA